MERRKEKAADIKQRWRGKEETGSQKKGNDGKVEVKTVVDKRMRRKEGTGICAALLGFLSLSLKVTDA